MGGFAVVVVVLVVALVVVVIDLVAGVAEIAEYPILLLLHLRVDLSLGQSLLSV